MNLIWDIQNWLIQIIFMTNSVCHPTCWVWGGSGWNVVICLLHVFVQGDEIRTFLLSHLMGFLICLSEVKWAQMIYPLKLRNVYFMSSNLLNKSKLLLFKTHVSQSRPFYWESFTVWCGLFEPWKEIYLLLQELKCSYMYVNQNCWWLFYRA